MNSKYSGPISRRARFALAAVALIGLAVAPPGAFAEDDDEVPGEVIIKTKFNFVKFQVDNKSTWENHTYINGQKTLHIFGLSRDNEHVIVVQPREAGYEPITLDIDSSKFKRTRVKRDGQRILAFQQTFRPKFKKIAAAKESAPKAEKKPAKKPRSKRKKK